MQEFYGDQIRWFMGIVEQVGGDWPQLGRVRVRIFGIHAPDIELKDLPYANVVIPATEGGVSGIGRSTGLIEGATVFGIFMDGKNSQLPLVIGSIPKIEVPSPIQQGMTRGQIQYTSSNVPFNANVPTVDQALLGPQAGYTYNPGSEYSENVQIAWDWFMKTNRYSPVSIAAMLGNFMIESRMKTGAKGDTNLNANGSIGIAQWFWYGSTGGRQAALKAFAQANNKPWDDLYLQLAFVDHELSTDRSLKGAEFKTITDVATAAIHFCRHYENPASTNEIGPDGLPKRLHQDERVSYALSIYENFASGASARV